MKFEDVKVGEKFIDIKYSGIFIRIEEDEDGSNAIDVNSENSGAKFHPIEEVSTWEIKLWDAEMGDEPAPEDLIDGEAELRSLPGYNDGF